jgi:acyl-CoA reductase-like NAD-dependent aldehyde dehydrogenase
MNHITSTNPAKNYEEVGKVEISTLKEIQDKVAQAHKAKQEWKELGIEERIKLLYPLYEAFVKRKDDIAFLITKEIGAPITDSKQGTDGYLAFIKWCLDNSQKALSDEVTYEDEKSVHKITYEPYGVAAVITPWNYPFGMFAWGVIPNLLAGNTVVYKISKECILTGRLLEEIIESLHLPDGVFTEIYGSGEQGKQLINEDVDFIWFTGSTEVGRQIYELSAKKCIRCVMEMGGNNPCVVFDDVDLNEAVKKIYPKRFKNCGQSCDALKRLIVHKSIFNDLVEKLKQEIASKKVGDPMDESTDLGSLVSQVQLELVESQVEDAKNKGANIIIGGERHKVLQGAFYMPTLLTDVTREMRVWKEEVFAPVLSVISFDTEQEAIELANDTEYGLGSIVLSKDKERALRVARKIESGTVEINSANHWMPCNPFGGYKQSGIGREHGEAGFKELVQIKLLSVEK